MWSPHIEQTWHVVTALYAHPFVRGILWVNGIISVAQRISTVLKACQKSLSFIKETALGLLVVVDMIRSPQRYLVEPLPGAPLSLLRAGVLTLLSFASNSLT